MVTYAIRKILRERVDAKLINVLIGYAKENWTDGQEMQRPKYDGTSITYYKKQGPLRI